MLHRLALRDFVIVDALEIELATGLTVLSGETGGGKSILVDALQLALGGRGDAGVVREGAARAEISAEFDLPAALKPWLDEAGFAPDTGDAGRLLLRRVIDAQGKSRAWINGSGATVAQLREAGERLVDIHGQHAWQGLTRPASVRAIVDAYAKVDTGSLGTRWRVWRGAEQALEAAQAKQGSLERERERLAWQIGELDKLGPGADEWPELDAEHTRLAHAQSLLEAAREALDAAAEGDSNADSLTGRAADALQRVADYDATLLGPIESLRSAQAALQDAAHSLGSYLGRTELDPARLATLDARMSAWVGLARRHRRPPAELPALVQEWKQEARSLDEAADLAGPERAVAAARAGFGEEARRISKARQQAAPALATAVTRAMQQLGMAGGRFEVALQTLVAPQSFGFEDVELFVAGHAGSTPRPLARVASGGELSRIALAVAVVTSEATNDESAPGTLIFDEVDAGIGGAVAEVVGRLMKQLGRERQVLAVTHLPQVASCADHHLVVSKRAVAGQALSAVAPVHGEARVREIARMLGGEKLSSTSLAHAQEMLQSSAEPRRASTPKRAAP